MACEKGLNVVSVEAFDMQQHAQKYDVLVMSHIIEHFQYQDLIQFMSHILVALNQAACY